MLLLDDPMSPAGRNHPAARPNTEATAAAIESLRRKLLAGEPAGLSVHVPGPAPGTDPKVDAAARTIASLRREQGRVLDVSDAPAPLRTPVPAPPATDHASTVPTDLTPGVTSEPTRAAATPGDMAARLHALLVQCADLNGMQSCAVLDLATRSVVAQYLVADARGFAGHATRLANALRAAALGFELPGRVPDAAITYDEHHVLVRPIPGQDHLATVAILDRARRPMSWCCA